MRNYSIKNLSVPEVYKLMTQSIIPRPIALVSTQSAKGVGNLSPFSYFNAVSSKPACISLSFARKRDGSKKDSLVNIEETGELVVNSVSPNILEKVVASAASYEYGINELEKVGLTALASRVVKPVRVAESRVQFECRFYKSLEIGGELEGSVTTLVIAEILEVHVSEAVLRGEDVIAGLLEPVCRLGGEEYAELGRVLEVKVPRV